MGTVNLRDFPDALHEALRVEAAMRNTSIKALLEEAANEWLVRHGSPGNPFRYKGEQPLYVEGGAVRRKPTKTRKKK